MKIGAPKHATDGVLTAILFFVALFIRFPFFFRDYIDRDESTFILMGKSIADGHLPYVHLWDLKPPLLFYIIGAVEAIFPYSFIAVRFFGVLVVFSSALLLVAIVRQAGLKNSFLTGLLYIILSSELGSLQGVMSEHLAVLFLLLAVWLANKKKDLFYFLTGLLFGCALLCKLSYAYAVVLFALCFAFFEYRQEPWRLMRFLVLLFSGLLIPFLVIAFPFWQTGQLKLFVDSVFLAPMAYASAEHRPLTQKLASTWWVIAAGGLLSYGALRKANSCYSQFLWLIVALLLGTVYTFFSSGIVNGHYLIQVYPFVLLLANATISQKINVKLVYLALFVALISVESWIEYTRLWKHLANGPAHFYRPAFTAVNEIKKQHLENEKPFFADYHIGYWLLHQYPPAKAVTHPSNLSRAYLFKYFTESKTSLEEIKKLMEQQRPGIVVSSEERLPYFDEADTVNVYFKIKLREEFRQVYGNKEQKIFIWQRIKN